MMLYGSTTMGACYLVAAMCLRAAQAGEADKKQVRRIPLQVRTVAILT